MRKYIFHLILPLLCIVIMTGGCDEPQPSGNNNTTVNEDTGGVADMSEIKYWLTNSFSKIQPDTEGNGNTVYDIYMAKNESESCQLVLRSGEEMTGLKIIKSGPENINAEILREYYIETKNGVYYPDPLAPATDDFTLKADQNLTFLIKVKTNADTNTGEYNLQLEIKQSENTTAAIIGLRIHVWDFALPEASSCTTAVGLYSEFINKMHGVTDANKQKELYKAYYDFLLENRICAYSLPYDILDKRADEYLNNPRVTNFIIPYSENDDIIREYYNKLSSDPDWFAKGVFYPLDEPTSKEHLDKLKAICSRLSELYPDYQLVTPFFRNIQYDKDTDQIDFMTGLTNIWCPKSYMYITANIYTSEQFQKYAPFGARMTERKSKGDRVWWYVCWEPGEPYCNLFVDMEGIMHRLLFWQQKLYDVDGFLYWGVNYWRGTDDPWTDMRTVKDLSMDVFGDGSLLYNGSKAGIDGPIGSLRLEAVRDGIEDFEMFTLAEKYLGRDYVLAAINEITSSVIKYTKSEEKFINARIKIGSELEKAING
jgi:hypothetical protein